MQKDHFGGYYPNPQFVRKEYRSLCGEWKFAFADDGEVPEFSRTIVVPYSYECAASGIGDESVHRCVWYERSFDVRPHGGAVLLHFEAVDHRADVFINGKAAGSHCGGFTEFCLDITEFVQTGENVLTVRVFDSLDKSQLRGKQRAKEESYGCWYVQTTGIWKPVWLEYAGDVYLTSFRVQPSLGGEVSLSLRLSEPAAVRYFVYDGDIEVAAGEVPRGGREAETSFCIPSPKLWSNASPHLYRMKLVVCGEAKDEVFTYFGIREISVREDGVYINGRREFMQMVLDQGYWKDSGLTPPDAAALEKDVALIREMGFNGVRKHQKIESHIFYYLCDRYGLYVWAEIPSPYQFDEHMRTEFARDTADILTQLVNHPCIVCWLLFNETWGVYGIKDDREQQAFVEKMARFVKESDSRPVITNDGWSHLNSDILSLHEYEQNAQSFADEYRERSYVVTRKKINRNHYGYAFADGYAYAGQPIMISEYGGISIAGSGGWGYSEAESAQKLEERLRGLVQSVENIPYISGCCYTQLTDVQQEVNGLLTTDREPKLPIETMRRIFAVGKQ